MRLELYYLSDARKRLVDAERDRELVGDATAREDLDAIELFGNELSGDATDHRFTPANRPPMMCASAAAVPSAASQAAARS